MPALSTKFPAFERRAGIDGEISGGRESAVDRERVIRRNGDVARVGRVTRDRRRPVDDEGAAFNIQTALREAAVDLGHASVGEFPKGWAHIKLFESLMSWELGRRNC